MKEAERLRIQAERCLGLALQVPDERLAQVLMRLVRTSLTEAEDLDRFGPKPIRQQGSQAA